MKRVSRTIVTCALPGCGKQIELTPYQVTLGKDTNGHPRRRLSPTCTTKHARILQSLQGIRQDEAGPFLQDLVIENGGIEETVKRLRKGSKVKWHRTTLQLLMRTKGRIPRTEQTKDLARVARKPGELISQALERVNSAFGLRTDRRTAVIIATAREKFPCNPVRIAVADRIEREHKTVRAYAAVVGVPEESLRLWLLGKHKGLAEPVLRAIIRYEDLHPSKKWVDSHTSTASRQRLLARHRKNWKGKTHSDDMRDALSESREQMWKRGGKWRRGSPWTDKTGQRVIRAMLNGWNQTRAHEEEYVVVRKGKEIHKGGYLAYVIRKAVGHFNWSRETATSDVQPSDVLRVLCRILEEHRRQFPETKIRFEDLPQKAQHILGKSMHTALSVNGRPFDVKAAWTLLEVALDNDQSRPFLETTSLRLYDTKDRIASAKMQWSRIKNLPFDMLLRLANLVSRDRVDSSALKRVLERGAGRPAKAIPASA